jgi:hypothetical protein
MCPAIRRSSGRVRVEEIVECRSIIGFIGYVGGWHCKGVNTESMFESLNNIGTGYELSDGWKIVDGIDPETLEELWRRSEEDGLSGAGISGYLSDIPSLLECSHDAVDAHPADSSNLSPTERLLVRDDGKSLERRGGQFRGLAFEYETFDIGRHCRMALVPPASSNARKLESPILLGVFRSECGQLRFDLGDALIGQLREHLGLKRRVSDHDDRFQSAT